MSTATSLTTTSTDGTRIAYSRLGDGPPVVLVDGALCYRASGPSAPLAEHLADRFTVLTYDRRGRGESGDTPPYAVEREVEDLGAVVKEAGGSAMLYGISSGAMLALEAVAKGVPAERLAVYEAPLVVDASRRPLLDDYVARMDALVASGDHGGAVKHFMRTGVEVPAAFVALMRLLPVWSTLRGVAHTLPYDTALTAPFQRGAPLPRERWAGVTVPTLVLDGGKSQAWMRAGMAALAAVLPNARYRTLEGQDHRVKPQVLAPVLTEFFRG